MSNSSRAAEIIDEWIQTHTLTGDTGNPKELVRVLEFAGVLAPETDSVTRITVAGSNGRDLEKWNIENVSLSVQDQGRTLKVFYRENSTCSNRKPSSGN